MVQSTNNFWGSQHIRAGASTHNKVPHRPTVVAPNYNQRWETGIFVQAPQQPEQPCRNGLDEAVDFMTGLTEAMKAFGLDPKSPTLAPSAPLSDARKAEMEASAALSNAKAADELAAAKDIQNAAEAALEELNAKIKDLKDQIKNMTPETKDQVKASIDASGLPNPHMTQLQNEYNTKLAELQAALDSEAAAETARLELEAQEADNARLVGEQAAAQASSAKKDELLADITTISDEELANRSAQAEGASELNETDRAAVTDAIGKEQTDRASRAEAALQAEEVARAAQEAAEAQRIETERQTQLSNAQTALTTAQAAFNGLTAGTDEFGQAIENLEAASDAHKAVGGSGADGLISAKKAEHQQALQQARDAQEAQRQAQNIDEIINGLDIKNPLETLNTVRDLVAAIPADSPQRADLDTKLKSLEHTTVIRAFSVTQDRQQYICYRFADGHIEADKENYNTVYENYKGHGVFCGTARRAGSSYTSPNDTGLGELTYKSSSGEQISRVTFAAAKVLTAINDAKGS